MSINPDLCWFQRLAEHINQLNPLVQINDEACHCINDELTALGFGADRTAVLAVLTRHGLPETVLDGFDFEAWQIDELAPMQLRRRIREQRIPFPFDRNNTRAQFVAQITQPHRDDTLIRVIPILIQSLPVDANYTAENCSLAAVADAYFNEGLYAFTEQHRTTFRDQFAEHPLFERLFAALIDEIADIHLKGADHAAALARLGALQALIGTAEQPGPAFSQKSRFDQAVIAQAKPLLKNAAATTFADVAKVLQACEGGQEALDGCLGNYDDVLRLINRGVKYIQFVIAKADVAARIGLLSNLEALFASGITPGNYNVIAGFVKTGVSVAPNALKKFDAKFAEPGVIDQLLDDRRQAGALSAAQLKEFCCHNESWDKSYKVYCIGIALKQFTSYMDSVQQVNGQWRHKPPRSIDEVDCSLADIQKQLASYKSGFQQINTYTDDLEYQRSKHHRFSYEASTALQDFVENNPLIANKLGSIYGSFKQVARQFTLCDLPKPVGKESLIADVKRRIDAAVTGNELEVLPGYIAQLKAAWYLPNRILRNRVARAAAAHLLSTEVLLGLLGKTIQLAGIVKVYNLLSPKVRVSVENLQARLLDCVKDLLRQEVTPGNVGTLGLMLYRIMVACLQQKGLDTSAITQVLRDNFLVLVGSGLITQDNFGAVKGLLGNAVREVDLVRETQRRQQVFFAETLRSGRVSRAAILKELGLLGTATHKVGGGNFNNLVYDEQENQVCQLDKLLANGLTLEEVLTTVSQSTMTAKPELSLIMTQLGNRLLQKIQGILDLRVSHEEFAGLARIFNNVGSSADAVQMQDTIRAKVNEQALNLFQVGVKLEDLRDIDPRLTLIALEERVLQDQTLDIAVRENRLQQLRQGSPGLVLLGDFLNALPAGYQAWALKILSDHNIPEPQAKVILAKAFAAIRFKYPHSIDQAGQIIDEESSDARATFYCYREAFNAAVDDALRESVVIRDQQQLSPHALSSSTSARRAVEDLRSKIEGLRGKSTGDIQQLLLLVKTLETLQEDAASTLTPDAFNALKLAQQTLSACGSGKLIFCSVKDRVALTQLAAEVDQSIIALCRLVNMNMTEIFAETLLRDIHEAWEIDQNDAKVVEAALEKYLGNPILLYQAKAEGFKPILESFQDLSADHQAVLIHNLTLSIEKAEQAVVDAIQQSLSSQRVMGYFVLPNILQNQAKELWHRRLDLARIKLEIQGQLSQPNDVAELRMKIEALQATPSQAPVRVASPEQKQIVVFESTVQLPLSRKKVTFNDVEALFSDNPSASADAWAPARNRVDVQEWAGYRYPIKLGPEYFTMVDLVRAEGTSVRVQMNMREVLQVNRQRKTLQPVDLSSIPRSDFFDLAFRMGVVWAQARMDVYPQETWAKFWREEKKSLEISGDFKDCDTREGRFELAVMYAAIAHLKQKGYEVKASPAYERFQIALDDEGADVIAEVSQRMCLNGSPKLVSRANLAESMERVTIGLKQAFARD